MDISNLKYNSLLIKTKARLERELAEAKRLLNEQQEKCHHVSVCLGFSGPYQYRDTSIDKCLLCGAVNPEDSINFHPIDATYYKKDEYGYGSLTSQRDKRFEELQRLWIQYVTEFPELTEEALIEKMNEEIKRDQEETKSLVHKI